MISIYNFKPRFQQLLKPLLPSLHRAGITPNMITGSTVIACALLGITLWNNLLQPFTLLLLPAGLLLRIILNALDGMMASTYNLKSKKGELLNEFGDVLSDLFIYLPLIKITGSVYIIFLFVILSVLNEFAGILAKVISGVRRYEGPMGKSDRAFFTGLYCILLFFNIPLNLYADPIFTAASSLILLSTIIRLKKSLL